MVQGFGFSVECWALSAEGIVSSVKCSGTFSRRRQARNLRSCDEKRRWPSTTVLHIASKRFREEGESNVVAPLPALYGSA